MLRPRYKLLINLNGELQDYDPCNKSCCLDSILTRPSHYDDSLIQSIIQCYFLIVLLYTVHAMKKTEERQKYNLPLLLIRSAAYYLHL